MKAPQFLTLRERLVISRREKLAKFRREKHLRKDGWVSPQERMATAEKLCRYRIRRIEWPKFGDPVTLSETDKSDAMQAGLMACVETGFFEHGIVTREVTKSIRRAMESRDCLRRDCIRETGTSTPELVAAAVGYATEYEEHGPRLTKDQRNMIREMMRDLRAAKRIDTSRKSESAFRSHRNFLLETLGQLTGRTPRQRTAGSFAVRAHRFSDYLKTGWRENHKAPRVATREEKKTLRADWMENLASSFLA